MQGTKIMSIQQLLFINRDFDSSAELYVPSKCYKTHQIFNLANNGAMVFHKRLQKPQKAEEKEDARQYYVYKNIMSKSRC